MKTSKIAADQAKFLANYMKEAHGLEIETDEEIFYASLFQGAIDSTLEIVKTVKQILIQNQE